MSIIRKHESGGILLSDGTLVFPVKGKPPRPVQGFVRDSSNPYAFKPILASCMYRKIDDVFYQKCGCTGQKITCKLFSTIDMSRCYNCKERKDGQEISAKSGAQDSGSNEGSQGEGR